MESSKGFFEKFPFPIPWVVSAALALGAGAVLLLPSMVEMVAVIGTGSRPQPTHFDAVWEAVWLVVAVLIAGYVLEALSTPMYQILEGYLLWPERLKARRRCHHIDRLAELQLRLSAAREGAQTAKGSLAAHSVPFIEASLALYPVDKDSVAATRLGNVMRAMESYGMSHFALDSQRLWYELTTVAPVSLQMELMRSRQSVDFFVATLFTSTLFATAAILTGVLENATGFANQPGVRTYGLVPGGQASVGPFSFGVAPFHIGIGNVHILIGLLVYAVMPFICYRLAIRTAVMWAGAIRALVNLGRIELATALNLVIPDTHESEMQMWNGVSNFVGHRESAKIIGWAYALDSYRNLATAIGRDKCRLATEPEASAFARFWGRFRRRRA